VGEQIPIGARILMVVDCFDALTSDRPYRPRIDDAAALQVLEDRKGTMYDPRVVDGFADLYRAESADVQAESASSAALADVSATIPILSESDSPATAPGDGESELHAFYALGRALRDEPDLARLGQTLWHHLQRHLPATSFVLFVYDPPSDGLVPAYQSEHGPHRADEGILLGERLSGWVAATRQAVVNAEARLDLEGPLRDASALRSALAVPVTAGGRAVGVLTFYAEQTRAFDERHRRIADAAAMAAAEHFPVSAAASAPAEQVRNGTRVS
jgi:hypothetical protein